MNLAIFYIVLAAFALFSVLISRPGIKLLTNKTLSDLQKRDQYYLGGRTIGVLPLALTFLATQLGGGAIIGTSEAAFNLGWRAIYYALGISLGLFVLASGVGSRLRQLEVSTIPEIFDSVYRSKFLRTFAAIIIISSMFCILVALGVATRKLFISLGFMSEYYFFIFWGIIIFYTTFGGFNAVVKTDILQILFVLATFALAFGYIIGFSNYSIIKTLREFPEVAITSTVPYVEYLLMPLFYTIIGQDMGQRCFAAKNPQVVTKSTIIAGVLLTLSTMLPVSMGMFARALELELTGASVLVEVMQIVTTPTIASLFAGSILIAILSTADSLICAISSNISFDLLQTTRPKLTKLLTLLIGLAAIGLSFRADMVLEIMVLAYEFTVCSLLVPILMSIIIQRPSKAAAYSAVSFGVIGFILLGWVYGCYNYQLYVLSGSSLLYLLVNKLKPTS